MMRWLYRFPLRFRSLFRKGRVEDELRDVLRFHLENQIEQNIAMGMTAEEARYAALRAFGGVEQIKEECRDSWGVRFINELGQDIRYGLRQLRRNPGFTVVGVIRLAIGIGVNTAMFSVGDALLFHPLPYVHDASRLVTISEWTGYWGVTAPANFLDWKAQSRSFSTMAAFQDKGVTLTGGDSPTLAHAAFVSRGFFRTLGVMPALGRTFTPEEEDPVESTCRPTRFCNKRAYVVYSCC